MCEPKSRLSKRKQTPRQVSSQSSQSSSGSSEVLSKIPSSLSTDSNQEKVAKSVFLSLEEQRNLETWSHNLPMVKNGLNAVIKKVLADVTVEGKETIMKEPKITDLCIEDKKRIMRLVEELGKNVEEKQAMSEELSDVRRGGFNREKEIEKLLAEVCILKRDVIQRDGEMERLSAVHANRQQSLQTEVTVLKHERECLAKDLEVVTGQKECLEEKLGMKHSRNKELEREKCRLQSQLLLAKRKLAHAIKVSELCKSDLKKAVKLLKRQEERYFVDREVQTEDHAEEELCAVSSAGIEPIARPSFSDGAENLLLSELFFKSPPAIPLEMESIFFLPDSFNHCDRDVWNTQ